MIRYYVMMLHAGQWHPLCRFETRREAYVSRSELRRLHPEWTLAVEAGA